MSDTEQKLLKLLKVGPLTPSDMADRIGVSRQALHRYLKVLLRNKQIEKRGIAPHVTYALTFNHESRLQESMFFFQDHLLAKYLNLKKFKNAYGLFCSKQTALLKAEKPSFAFMLDTAAVYSSNIEGNSLNLNSFLNSRMQSKKLRPKEAQEIEDLVKAYLFSQNHVLNEKNVLYAHAILGRKFINERRRGVYRKESVGVFSSRGMEYLAIEPQYVSHEMHELFEVITVLLKNNFSPLETFFWASWLHLMMVLIHPFADGNGRIARLCEKWFLAAKLGSYMVFLPSEEYYFQERSRYYSALRLGINYWEVDFSSSMKFLKLLPQALSFTERR